MSLASRHPVDDLQLLLDGQLPAERHRDLEAHLAECTQCRREMAALRGVVAATRSHMSRHELPTEVSARIRSAIAAEASDSPSTHASESRFPRRAVIVGGAALAAAAAFALLLPRRRSGDVVASAVDDFARLRAGRLTLDLTTTEPVALERFFGGGVLGFSTRVFDFGMMGYGLAGGGVHDVAGTESALFAYASASGRRLLCQMYRGSVLDLPLSDEERVINGIEFLVYGRADLTLVFWQEGPVVCVLVSDGDPSEAIALAAAKATRV